MLNHDRLIRACRRHEVDRAPVWMLGQAGAYLPEYHTVRGTTTLSQLYKTPELVAEISMLPYDLLGVDAVILFSDLLLPVEAMGLSLAFSENKGAVIASPIRTAAQVEQLIVPDPIEQTGFVMEAIRLLRKQLNHEAPLIGLAGAPWTLASLIVEGASGDDTAIKRMMFVNPALLHQLLEKIADTIADFLNAQIEAGAQIIQLFDNSAGELSAADFEEFALQYQQRVLAKLHRGPAGLGVPAILYINGCGHILEKMAEAGANVLSLDWRIDLAEARYRLFTAGFDHIALQGNLDPCALLGTPETIAAGVREVLEKADPVGHIMNLGDNLLPMVPVENARAFIEATKAGIKEAA